MPNRPEKYKDMERYLRTRNAQRHRYYGKTAFKYRKRAWTQYEDRLVMEHDMTDTELSKLINRSVSAIQCRRYRINKTSKEE